MNDTTQLAPTILIIIGISGDLAQRKLLPAIAEMAVAKQLPKQFKVLGVTRRNDVHLPDLLSHVADKSYLLDNCQFCQVDLTQLEEYDKLAAQIQAIETEFGQPAQRLFYLSIPPQVSRPIIEFLGTSGLAKAPNTKLLLEKPFGVDLASATELVEYIKKFFTEEQVYRIDHYLAKETAQNLIVFRDGNSLFKRTWNNEFIESIEIVASEQIGIEGRAVFYEQTGALRDLVQSHLLQLAALTLMGTAWTGQLDEVPLRRFEALKQLEVLINHGGKNMIKRAQYQNYATEVGNPGSTIETFVSLTLQSSDPKWLGVPITLTTGKALHKKYTEIRITYKKEKGYESNELILQIQPDEGVKLAVWEKKPGYDHQVSKHTLQFAFKDHYSRLPEAYEQVLFAAINSDHTLFASSAEILETWRILNPVQQMWEMEAQDLLRYPVQSSVEEVLQLFEPLPLS